jgi:hypothetical protein
MPDNALCLAVSDNHLLQHSQLLSSSQGPLIQLGGQFQGLAETQNPGFKAYEWEVLCAF